MPFSETHDILVKAPIERVWQAMRELDMRESPVIRTLFFLRGIPAWLSGRGVNRQRPLGTSIDALVESGFVVLEEATPRYVALGLIGRFWTMSGGIQRVEAKDFEAFALPGFAKAHWTFQLSETPDGVRVVTETTITCTDEESRRRFARYWHVIAPFSAWTRREMLRVIRKSAEGSTRNHA